MAFTALGPIAAEAGGKVFWKALPWVIAGGAVLILGCGLWTQTARLDAKQTELRAATRSLKEAREDTGRWKLASDECDQAIGQLNGEVDRLRADAAQAEQVAARAAAANRKARDDLRQAQAALKEKARANPNQVMPVGPLAAAFADGLQP